MTTVSHTLTFRQSCSGGDSDSGSGSGVECSGSIIINPAMKSSEFYEPCPNSRYFIYLSDSDAPISISGVNCDIGNIGPSNVPVDVNTIQGTPGSNVVASSTTSADREAAFLALDKQRNDMRYAIYNDTEHNYTLAEQQQELQRIRDWYEGQKAILIERYSDPRYWNGNQPFPSSQSTQQVGNVTYYNDSSDVFNDYSVICGSGNLAQPIGTPKTQYATYFEVLNTGGDGNWTHGGMMAAIQQGPLAALNYCLGANGSDIVGMVAVCQGDCLTIESFTSKACGCNLCWNCQECCDKSHGGLAAPDVGISGGQSEQVYFGGCPPYMVSFINNQGDDVSGQTDTTGGFQGSIAVNPAGWVEDSVYGPHQPERYKNAKYVTFVASDDVCGKIGYVVTDACGATGQGTVDAGCCHYDSATVKLGNRSCFTNSDGNHSTADAVPIALAVSTMQPPINFSVQAGGGTIVSSDSTLGTAIFKANTCGDQVIRARDSCGNTQLFTLFCSDFCCPPEEPTQWDSANSADTITQGGHAIVAVKGTLATGGGFEWELSGTGYMFSSGTNKVSGGNRQVIYADSSSCGGCYVTCKDICGSTVSGSLRNTDSGHWSTGQAPVENPNCQVHDDGWGGCYIDNSIVSGAHFDTYYSSNQVTTFDCGDFSGYSCGFAPGVDCDGGCPEEGDPYAPNPSYHYVRIHTHAGSGDWVC